MDYQRTAHHVLPGEGFVPAEPTAYETQAQEFLDRFSLRLKATFGDSRCPSWESGNCLHGDHYRITIRRNAREWRGSGHKMAISFDFWNSYQDMREGKAPTAYDVLASISSDVHMPTDPDEVVEELGDMKPSQAIAVAKFARRLQAFFTESEQDALMEIQ